FAHEREFSAALGEGTRADAFRRSAAGRIARADRDSQRVRAAVAARRQNRGKGRARVLRGVHRREAAGIGPQEIRGGRLVHGRRSRCGGRERERLRIISADDQWRKRVGVEPTILAAKDRINGFEGHESRRTPFASAGSKRRIKISHFGPGWYAFRGAGKPPRLGDSGESTRFAVFTRLAASRTVFRGESVRSGFVAH